MILTATEVTIYSNITASVGTITTKNLIPIVQERLTNICNNFFVTDLQVNSSFEFNATAKTIIWENNNWNDWNFLAGDDIYIYHSYRNDGYYTVDSVSTSTITLITGSTVVDELSGRSILISVVKWPIAIKKIAALMCEYDFDVRPQKKSNVKSRSLGPFSESYGIENYGYPDDIIESLNNYKIVRLM